MAIDIASTPIGNNMRQTKGRQPMDLRGTIIITPSNLGATQQRQPFRRRRPFLISTAQFTNSFVGRLRIVTVRQRTKTSRAHQPIIRATDGHRGQPTKFNLPMIISSQRVRHVTRPANNQLIRQFSDRVRRFRQQRVIFTGFDNERFFRRTGNNQH